VHIIAKVRDYYDCMMQHGQDMSVTFMRLGEQLYAAQLPGFVANILTTGNKCTKTFKKNDIEIKIDGVNILFCGNLYHGIRAKITVQDSSQFYGVRHEFKTFYNFDELVDFLVSYGHEEVLSDRYWKPKTLKIVECLKSLKIHDFLEKQGTSELMDFCIENRWIVSTSSHEGYFEYQIILNGSNLKDFQFYKMFDHQMAYQELDMFISGVLPTSTQMPIEIEDKYRIPQHGFDKFSFRKPKSKHK